MSDNKKRPEPGKFTILTEHCKTKERLLDVVSQLADAGKSMNIVTNDMIGWDVAYNTGPSRT